MLFAHKSTHYNPNSHLLDTGKYAYCWNLRKKPYLCTMTRGRFAPSPTGRMHLGNVFCALLSWLSAKSKGGEWVLRIEDLDPQRSKREYALQLMDDLQWLGLTWDGDPVWQSQRGDIYEQYLKQLATMQMIYPCYCTRADIMATQAPHETDGRIVYKGTCRPEHHSVQSSIPSPSDSLSPSEDSLASTLISQAATIRLMVPDENIPFVDGNYGEQSINLTEHCGDYIIRRKDGAWAYQLAVVIDDALMGVNEIVRGRDLLLSSPQQIHLRKVLFPNIHEAVNFIHHPLLCVCGVAVLQEQVAQLGKRAKRQRKSSATLPIWLVSRRKHTMPHQKICSHYSLGIKSVGRTYRWSNCPHFFTGLSVYLLNTTKAPNKTGDEEQGEGLILREVGKNFSIDGKHCALANETNEDIVLVNHREIPGASTVESANHGIHTIIYSD